MRETVPALRKRPSSLTRYALLLALLVSALAPAQERGFRAHRYDGATVGSWLFLVQRPWYSQTRFVAVGVTADGSLGVLEPRVATGRGPLTPIVSSALVAHAEVAFSLFDRVLLGASLPVTLLERGAAELVSGAAPLVGVGLGDPRASVMVRLAGEAERDALSLHLGADAWVPLGLAATHQGDTAFRVMPRAVLAGAAGVTRWTLELAYLHRPYASIGPPGLGLVAAPEARAGLAFGVSLFGDRLYLGPEAQLAMQVQGDDAFTVNGMSLEVLGGLKYLIGEQVQLGLAGGAGFFGMAGTPDARALVKLAWSPRRDSDDDGLPNLADACPEVAGPRGNNGCFDPATEDADLDAVPNGPDRCPFEPETINGIRDDDGCPEYGLAPDSRLARVLLLDAMNGPRPRSTPLPLSPLGERAGGRGLENPTGAKSDPDKSTPQPDKSPPQPDKSSPQPDKSTPQPDKSTPQPDKSPPQPADAPLGSEPVRTQPVIAAHDLDGDGVLDDADRCPMEPEDLDAFEDEDGCPERDNDADGIADAADRCVDAAEVLNGVDDGDGCPDAAPDADQDGIADGVDRCPFEPEDVDGLRDDDGCPEHPFTARAALAQILAPAPARAAPQGAPESTEPTRPPPDADGDGIPDDDDRCPVTAEDRDGFEDDDGCPELDNDDDGIADAKDRCVDAAETVNAFEDDDGCPEEHPDADGDGLPYALDRCPLEPGAPGDGCPHAPPPALWLPDFPLALAPVPATAPPEPAAPRPPGDLDRDGSADDADACPMTKEDLDGFEDEDGCPEPDNDRDGLLDAKDTCPLAAENINGLKDDDGCPDLGESQVHVVGNKVVIDDVVRFKPASATLEQSANKLLSQVAATLRAAATLSVEIQGHTDDTGSAALNIKLSQRRSETIRAFLVKAGVAANRLVAKGYGPTKPRATNKTPAGREQNRRVEFLILGEAK
jgi:outer membrane protein OmpA-like peptidoglycan-associated protein